MKKINWKVIAVLTVLCILGGAYTLAFADISVDGKVAVVEGTGKLTGAPVKACDLRAGAALIIAGLAAKGITEIEDIYHIERGYSCLDEKLRQVGADIQKVSTPVSTLREAL